MCRYDDMATIAHLDETDLEAVDAALAGQHGAATRPGMHGHLAAADLPRCAELLLGIVATLSLSAA